MYLRGRGGYPPVEMSDPSLERRRILNSYLDYRNDALQSSSPRALEPLYDYRNDPARLPSRYVREPQYRYPPEPVRMPIDRPPEPQYDYRKDTALVPSRQVTRFDNRNDTVLMPVRAASIQQERRRGRCSDGCVHCMQVTVVIFNVIFLLIGLAVVGVGIWLQLDPLPLDYKGGSSSFGKVVTYMVLVTGGATFVVSFIGLTGAAGRNRCLLVTYICLVSILLIPQFGLIFLALIHQIGLGTSLHDAMARFMVDEYDGGVSDVSKAWDTMQVELHCCGVDGRDDWVNRNTVWYNVTGQPKNWTWPESCCPLMGIDPRDDLINPEKCRTGASAYTTTCYEALKEVGSIVAGIVGSLIALQLLGIILAGLLQHEEKKKGQTVAPHPGQTVSTISQSVAPYPRYTGASYQGAAPYSTQDVVPYPRYMGD